ncbi:MAG: DHH family phosphoesterase [Nanoarchaeota archaeon]|nr:DHH family phosphoesterase [Nanoarchaeota archaeon]
MAYTKAKQRAIGTINREDIKTEVIVVGLIERVIQTGGPTIFAIVDGTGNLSLKGFISPGERAYPEIDGGDYVEAWIKIDEFQGEMEGNILKIKKKTAEEEAHLKKHIEHQQRERAKVVNKDFMLKNDILEKLKAPILKAAEEIRLAVIQSRPIIVRHHNDTDGYCSGFALERAILPLIERQHSAPKAAWEFFKRAPSTAPYYELEDSIKDTAMSLRNVARFSNKMPLIIIVDNGSGEEDLMAIKQARIHGADVIVIDHHGFEKDVISSEVLAHINPHLVGEEGSHISAGMLCVETARFINEALAGHNSGEPKVESLVQIPALSGYADRIDIANAPLVEEYMELAKKEGYTKELLSDISLVIEFVSTKVRFMEAREYVEVLFGEPRDKQKGLVDLMAPHIRELDRKGLAIGKVAAEIEELSNGVTLQTIDIDKSFPGFGFFPKPGRSTGLLHDNLKKEGATKLVSAGIMNTAITFRATDEANFSVHGLLKELREKLPNAFVEGGGHKNAGAINFIPRKKEEVVAIVKEFVGR